MDRPFDVAQGKPFDVTQDRQKGNALIMVIFITTIFMLVGVGLSRIVFSGYRGVGTYLAWQQAFYLAEAGIERAKWEIAKDSDWHTDGYIESLGEGYFEIIKRKGENSVYSTGYKDSAQYMIKISYSFPPIKQLSWERL